MAPAQPAYRLVRRPAAAGAPPALDDAQRAVVEHEGGPLLVLAGPGTGKTTTIVEAVAARVAAGLDPERVLVLTFSRKAAAELRARIVARVGATTKEPLARTFHSYAFAVLRREAALRGEPAPRLLSGAEQDLVVRDLLTGDAEAGAGSWPPALREALTTRGFAQELRDLLLRCYERGVDASRLAELAGRTGRDDWRAAAGFLRQYAEITALRPEVAYDPAELIRAVVELWQAEPDLLLRERAERPLVFVDEFQDTDPVQVELLELLAGEGRDLVVVGDPDQSIYGFRGADVGGIRDFPDRFRTRAGAPAPVVALTTCRRAGPELLAASRRVADRLGGPARHRRLAASSGLPAGEVDVRVLRSRSQEAAYVASRLREEHLRRGVPWSRMAVLVRSTVGVLPALRRALAAAGVPVAVSAEEVPLVEQPAVRPLLLAMRCALHPKAVDEDAAVALLTSPLGGADALALRRLRQELRRLELAGGRSRASGELLVEALTAPGELVLLDRHVRRPAERVVAVLTAGREAVAAPDASAEDVLWALWSASGLAGRWQQQSLDPSGGGARAAAADRDLDAVVALFGAAARFVDRLPGAGPEVFLDSLLGQQIPADTLAARAPEGEAVQVLTAHASKGLEWDVVAVAAVQEGSWPDLRMRGSFLGVEQLVELAGRPWGDLAARRPAALAMLSRLLDEERRLVYVAATRARRHLLVTAVANEREDLQPSRFLDEIDPLSDGADRRPVGEAPRTLSLAALVGELRRVLLDPAQAPLHRQAAGQLARLAAAGVRGAHPSSWYGLAPLSDDRPVVDDGDPVPVSPSKVESFERCQLRWFLEHVGGTAGASSGQSVGTLVHAVAASVTGSEPALEEVLLRRLQELAAGADLGRGWAARRLREQADEMVRRLAGWMTANSRSLVAAELEFEATVGRAQLRGRVDRIERDDEGRAVVVDFKTGSSKADDRDLPAHPQLGAYQLAVASGGFPGVDEPGGAELVQLGKGATTQGARVQRQEPLGVAEDPFWAQQLVVRVAEGMAGSAFDAMANTYCPRCPTRTSCPLQDAGRQVAP